MVIDELQLPLQHPQHPLHPPQPLPHQQPADAISYLEQQRQLLRSSGHMALATNAGGAAPPRSPSLAMYPNCARPSGAHMHAGAPRGARAGRGPGGGGGGGNQRTQRAQRPSEEQRALFGLNLEKVRSGYPNPNPNP